MRHTKTDYRVLGGSGKENGLLSIILSRKADCDVSYSVSANASSTRGGCSGLDRCLLLSFLHSATRTSTPPSFVEYQMVQREADWAPDRERGSLATPHSRYEATPLTLDLAATKGARNSNSRTQPPFWCQFISHFLVFFVVQSAFKYFGHNLGC